MQRCRKLSAVGGGGLNIVGEQNIFIGGHGPPGPPFPTACTDVAFPVPISRFFSSWKCSVQE